MWQRAVSPGGSLNLWHPPASGNLDSGIRVMLLKPPLVFGAEANSKISLGLTGCGNMERVNLSNAANGTLYASQ